MNMLGLPGIDKAIFSFFLQVGQYLGVLLGVIGYIFIERKNKYGWLIWYISSILVIPWLLSTHGYGLAIMQMIYMGLNVFGWHRWSRQNTCS